VVFVPLAVIIQIMNWCGKREIYVLIGVLLSAGASAVVSDNAGPYDGIVERNVFNLHAPAPAPNPADLIAKAPVPKVTFTGITTILGKKLAFLTIPATKPGSPPESMMLAEGQAQMGIEVKQIDDKAGIVKIVNHEEPQTLDFDHDGAKPSGPPPAAPSIPTPAVFPRPAMPPAGVQPGNVIRPIRSLQSRGSSPLSEGNNNWGGGIGSANNAQGGAPPLTPEEQVALIEVQREKYQQENNPIGNLLPPTEMSPGTPGNPAPGGPAPQ
jgi:hypothetical protein